MNLTVKLKPALTSALLLAALSACQPAESPEVKLASMVQTIDEAFPTVEQLSTTELAQWLADPTRPQPQLLDVREAAEYAISHLPGAIRIDPDADSTQIAAVIDPTKPIVVYCSVGYRSSAMAQKIQSVTSAKPINLRGSIFAWANEQRPLESAAGTTQQVHPYDSHYGNMVKPAYRFDL